MAGMASEAPAKASTATLALSEIPSNLSQLSVLTLRTDMRMCRESNRLSSFAGWPFQENCACTPAKMAQAGFYHCPIDNEPDLARCYVCFKELTGWEPDDDPVKEHARSVDCAFVQLKKTEADMTSREFLLLENARHRNRATKLKTVFDAMVEEKRRLVARAIAARRRKR